MLCLCGRFWKHSCLGVGGIGESGASAERCKWYMIVAAIKHCCVGRAVPNNAEEEAEEHTNHNLVCVVLLSNKDISM